MNRTIESAQAIRDLSKAEQLQALGWTIIGLKPEQWDSQLSINPPDKTQTIFNVRYSAMVRSLLILKRNECVSIAAFREIVGLACGNKQAESAANILSGIRKFLEKNLPELTIDQSLKHILPHRKGQVVWLVIGKELKQGENLTLADEKARSWLVRPEFPKKSHWENRDILQAGLEDRTGGADPDLVLTKQLEQFWEERKAKKSLTKSDTRG